MANTQDFDAVMKDMMGAFPVDMSALNDFFKTQAAFGEKLSKVALDAARKSAEISKKWSEEAIARAGDVTKGKQDPADYSKSVNDFAASQAELVSRNLAAFADIAKKAQMDATDLVMAAGKDMSQDTAAAAKKATADVTATAKKADAAK